MSSLFSPTPAMCCLFVAVMAVGTSSAHADCSATLTQAPKPTSSARLLDLLRDVPDGTSWAQLPTDTQTALKRGADVRLAWFRGEWNSASLRAKETVLLGCPTPKMTDAMDRYISHALEARAPAFSLNRLQSAALRSALVRLYLASLAAYRASITYPTGAMPNIDWDGQSVFSSFPLPDAVAYSDIRAYAATVVQDLRAIADTSLSISERRLRDQALFNAREIRAGSFIAKRGGQDWNLPCQISGAGDLIASGYMGDKGLPKVFSDEEDAVEEFNAVYLHNTKLKWVDAGTFPVARDNGLCNSVVEDDINEYVAPVSPDAARAMRILRGWWLERAGADLPPYSLYTASDREALWEAFTAEQRTGNDGGTSMKTYAEQVDAFRRDKVASYRKVAAEAIQAVFPDEAVLTESQKQGVLQAISNEEAFARFKDQVAPLLDRAQKTHDGPAATVWRATVRKHIQTLGGLQDNALRPADVTKAKAMFAEVQNWLLKRYQNYPRPMGPVLKNVTIVYNTDGGATTNTSTGEIRFGLATQRSLLEYYSLMLHELRHAVQGSAIANAPDPSKVATDEGVAVEGSGVAAEDLLRVPFLRDVVVDRVAVSLYQLDFAIRDARFIATTEATLKRYSRERCEAPECQSTVEEAKKIATQYGLSGPLADTLVARSHIGTQYLQYIFAGEQMKADLAFLAKAIGAPAMTIDPFMLFGCELNTPKRDTEYAETLKACLAKVP